VIDGRPAYARIDREPWKANAMPLDLESPGNVDAALATHRGVVYCVCPNEAIASQVSARMRSSGFTQVRSRKGDVDAWRRRGYPVEATMPIGEMTRGMSQPSSRDDALGAAQGAAMTGETPCKPVTLRGLAPKRADQPRRTRATG
jgi:rhodanese-related sulfurtransferase